MEPRPCNRKSYPDLPGFIRPGEKRQPRRCLTGLSAWPGPARRSRSHGPGPNGATTPSRLGPDACSSWVDPCSPVGTSNHLYVGASSGGGWGLQTFLSRQERSQMTGRGQAGRSAAARVRTRPVRVKARRGGAARRPDRGREGGMVPVLSADVSGRREKRKEKKRKEKTEAC